MNSLFESLNLILLNVGYSDLNADWNWKDVHSPFARIYYVKGGTAKVHIGDQIHILKPDCLYIIPPFTLHEDECDGLFSLYYIHFYDNANNKESIFDKYEFPTMIEASSLDLALVDRLLEINPDRYLKYIDPKVYDNSSTFFQYIAYNKTMTQSVFIETQSILSMLMSRFFETANDKLSNKDVRITKSLQYIHEHIDKNISITELAGLSCVSEDHFIRLFKKEMNQTPLKYINQKKIEKAQLLLLTTDMQVCDIAMELSMYTTSYFNKIFKQYIGKTPLQYREENAK